MFRIGILGSDNSHALAFAKLVNFPDEKTGQYPFEDLRIVGICGERDEENQKVFTQGGLEFIAEKPEDFFGKVDAMMIVYRHGTKHIGILPFVQAGIPCFIDKPFTADINEAYQIIDAAKRSGAPIMGGSSCKLVEDVIQLQAIARQQDPTVGRVLSAAVSYPADFNSPYNGLFFYAPHLVETTLTIFGYNMQSVLAVKQADGSVSAIGRYADFDVHMLFTNGVYHGGCMIVGTQGMHYRPIDYSRGYIIEMEQFHHMLVTGQQPQPYEQLVAPVAVIQALVDSINTGSEQPVRLR